MIKLIMIQKKKNVQELTRFELVSAVFVIALGVIINKISENIMRMKHGNVTIVIVKINQQKRNVSVNKLGQLTDKREQYDKKTKEFIVHLVLLTMIM